MNFFKLFFRLRYFILGIIVGFILGFTWAVYDVIAQGDTSEQNLYFQYSLDLNRRYTFSHSVDLFDKLDYVIQYIQGVNADYYNSTMGFNREDFCVVTTIALNFQNPMQTILSSTTGQESRFNFLIFPCQRYLKYSYYLNDSNLLNNKITIMLNPILETTNSNGNQTARILSYQYQSAYVKNLSYTYRLGQSTSSFGFHMFNTPLEDFKELIDNGQFDTDFRVPSILSSGSGSVNTNTMPKNPSLTYPGSQTAVIYYNGISNLILDNDIEVWQINKSNNTNTFTYEYFDFCTLGAFETILGDTCFSSGDILPFYNFGIFDDGSANHPGSGGGTGGSDIGDVVDIIGDSSIDTGGAFNFFNNFNSNNHGLTGIITAPLLFINRLTNSTCTPLSLPIPFVGGNSNATLPCMSGIYQTHFPDFLSVYQTITFGLVAYWVCVKIFFMVKGFKEPNSDRIEVLDL